MKEELKRTILSLESQTPFHRVEVSSFHSSCCSPPRICPIATSTLICSQNQETPSSRPLCSLASCLSSPDCLACGIKSLQPPYSCGQLFSGGRKAVFSQAAEAPEQLSAAHKWIWTTLHPFNTANPLRCLQSLLKPEQCLGLVEGELWSLCPAGSRAEG